MHIMTRFAAIAVISATFGGVANAQLPTAQQLFDKYATAVGGREAWAKVTDRTEKGSADISFAGMQGSYERFYGAPNKFRMYIDLGMAKIDQGTDGTIAWSVQPGAGGKLPPDDAAYLVETSATGSAFLDPTRFSKVTVLGQETFDGVACYKVGVTMKMGRERTDFFEVATGLRRGAVMQGMAGTQTSYFRNYKAFEGKMIATSIVQSTAQGDVVISVESVSFAPINVSTFVAPDGVAK